MNSTDKLKAKPASNLTDPMALGTHPQAKKARSVEEQKKEKKFLFQFVDHLEGSRSHPFVGNWDDVTDILNHRKPDERPGPKDYILLVAVLDGDDTQIPSTPLITVETFMNFSTQKKELAQ